MTSFERTRALGFFARRLTGFGLEAERGQAVLDDSIGPPVSHPRGADLTHRTKDGPEIVLSGWACLMRPDDKRRRQIFGFLLPGDVLGSFWRPAQFVFWRVTALTRLVTASAGALLEAGPGDGFAYPDVVQAARSAEDYAQHLLVDHMARLGGRDGYGGLTHLLLELHDRLDRVGLVEDGRFHLPVGQRVLAQAMGFSVVHTNQTLQRMVADGLLIFEGETVQLLLREQMIDVAGFVTR